MDRRLIETRELAGSREKMNEVVWRDLRCDHELELADGDDPDRVADTDGPLVMPYRLDPDDRPILSCVPIGIGRPPPLLL